MFKSQHAELFFRFPRGEHGGDGDVFGELEKEFVENVFARRGCAGFGTLENRIIHPSVEIFADLLGTRGIEIGNAGKNSDDPRQGFAFFL